MVLTLTIKLVGAVLLNATVAGTEQIAPVGAPLQLTVAVPLIPAPSMARVYVALCPAETEADAGPPVGTASPILGATAVPDSATVCGLLPASSVMVSLSVLWPMVVGVFGV